MRELYPTWPEKPDEDDKRSVYRLLKRLRIALFIWFLSFIATVLWFSFSA